MKRRLLTLLLAAMLLPGCSAAEPGEGMILLALNVGKADCLLLGSGGSIPAAERLAEGDRGHGGGHGAGDGRPD